VRRATLRTPTRTLRQRGDVEIGPPDPLMTELRELLRGAAAEEARGLRALDTGDFTTAADHFRKASR
jgi:hypothetical protein